MASCLQMIAEILRDGMKSDDRKIAADGEQDDARAVPAESRIEPQGPRQDLGAQKRSRTVADDDDFLRRRSRVRP